MPDHEAARIAKMLHDAYRKEGPRHGVHCALSWEELPPDHQRYHVAAVNRFLETLRSLREKSLQLTET